MRGTGIPGTMLPLSGVQHCMHPQRMQGIEPMAPSFAFLVQALVVIGFPFALWRWGRLGAAVPLVVVQILTGITLGPTGLGQAAPALEHLLFGPETLAPLSGIASIAV